MNKAFPMIKKDYSEKFGINNKNLDDVEMAQFIKNKIEAGQALITPKTEKTSTEAQTEPEAQEATPAEVTVTPKVETKIGVVGLKLYTKRIIKEYPEYNLKILRTKPQLINQLVDKQLWNEKDIYDYLKYFDSEIMNRDAHSLWVYLLKNTDLTIDCLDTMLTTYHDSDSYKDFNPLYYIANRNECTIEHSKGLYFNKYSNYS
jgi:hypothetical protein